MDKTKSDLIIENAKLKHRNKKLRILLKERKQKDFLLRWKCSILAFFKEFNEV